jgi:hypothetical protein
MKTTTFIYLVTNCYNDPNKIYIGKTINSRYQNHKKTYGNNIEYSIIDEIESLKRQDWEILETFWMDQFKQWGFELVNKRHKGGGGMEFLNEHQKEIRRKPKSLETKIKISQSNKGKKRTSEMIENYKQIRLGKKHSPETIKKFKDKTRTEESKIKQSNTLKGREITWDLGTKGKNISQSQKDKIALGNSKVVLQLDKNNNIINEFKSYTEAKKITNIDPQHCLIGKNKSAGGFIWKYKENYKKQLN